MHPMMGKSLEIAVSLNATESKSRARYDKTTDAANDIMRAERKHSEDKTERLKAARLARDATLIVPAPVKTNKPAKRKPSLQPLKKAS